MSCSLSLSCVLVQFLLLSPPCPLSLFTHTPVFTLSNQPGTSQTPHLFQSLFSAAADSSWTSGNEHSPVISPSNECKNNPAATHLIFLCLSLVFLFSFCLLSFWTLLCFLGFTCFPELDFGFGFLAWMFWTLPSSVYFWTGY